MGAEGQRQLSATACPAGTRREPRGKGEGRGLRERGPRLQDPGPRPLEHPCSLPSTSTRLLAGHSNWRAQVTEPQQT